MVKQIYINNKSLLGKDGTQGWSILKNIPQEDVSVHMKEAMLIHLKKIAEDLEYLKNHKCYPTAHVVVL